MSDRLYATYKLKEANLGLQIIFQILTRTQYHLSRFVKLHYLIKSLSTLLMF